MFDLSKIISLWEITKAYRIKNWFYYLGFVILGNFVHRNAYLDISSFLVAPFLLAYSYSLNDYYDEKGKRKHFLLPLVLSLVLLPLLNLSQIIVALTFLILVTAYSAKPFRLKEIPVIATLLNGVGFSLLFLFGYWSYPTIRFPLMFFTLLLFLNLTAQLIHEGVDMEKDERRGIVTTAMICGSQRLKLVISLLLLFTSLTAIRLFVSGQVNLIFLASTATFLLISIYKIPTSHIDTKLRMFFRNGGIITGIVWLISFWL